VIAESARFVILSGCSGGGKSTLLAELARRGFATVEEPGRRIVKQELAGDGGALPWTDPVAFGRRAIAMALEDLKSARRHEGWVFFDRGLIDAAAGLEHHTGEPALETWCSAWRFHSHVFLAPPWPEIYETDPERRHDLADALAEYERLMRVYPALGYEVVTLPKISVAARADFVMATLIAVNGTGQMGMPRTA
jgi:predicted ATPase